MEYTKTVWKDLPDTSTPITASRLNNIEDGVEYLFENGADYIETYSTDETTTNKIWVNNKPIYRKVIKRETVTSGTYTMIPTGIAFSSIGELIELKVLCKQNEADIWYSAPTNMSSDEIFGYYLSTNNVVVKSNSTLEKIIVILEYTKATD